MSEWWTYRPSSFLMFAPRTYWRLVERYQHEVWPLQWLMLAAGVALLWLAASRRANGARSTCTALALAWAWVGWGFHWQRYAAINWGARYFALAFAAESIMLLALATAGGKPPGPLRHRVGLLLAFCGVLVYPLAGVLAGRTWWQAELFGLMPEPTALATIGLLLATGAARSGWLMVIPAISLALGWTTLWLIGG